MDTIEIERKRQLPGDRETIEPLLFELGFRRASGPNVEIDTYYSPRHVDYLATVECLRVRQRDEFAEITYKPASDAETHGVTDIIAKVETNVALRSTEDADAANRLLQLVGMVELAQVRKVRVEYRNPEQGSAVVAVDAVEGVGTFIETEVTGDDFGRHLLEHLEQRLRITDCPVVKVPYRDLVRSA